MRCSSRLVVGLLLATSTGCFGGQTGQPGSLQCGSTTQATYEGRTAAEWTKPYEGEYRARLQWLTAEPSSPSARVIAFEDAVTIELHYEGVLGMVNSCGRDYDVPVSVDVKTDASALAEHGTGTLSFSAASLAALDFDGSVVSLQAQLLSGAGAGAAALEGSLVPRADGAPGVAAELRPLTNGGGGEAEP